jgi:glycosyltransferase involved in cell wall biosynthesis
MAALSTDVSARHVSTSPARDALPLLKIGYSATVWDGGRSGIGIYVAEQIARLYERPDIDLRVIEHGGGVLRQGALPVGSGTAAGVEQRLRPLRDIWWHRRTLRRVAAQERFDLVHVPTIRRLPGSLPCRAVVTVHDLGPIRMGKKYGLLRGAYHRQVVPRWLRTVDAIVTPSRSTLNDLVEFYGVDPARITVVPNGADHRLYREGDAQESRALVERAYRVRGPFFVYVSRLEHPAKNHVRLIEAFLRAKRQHDLPHSLVLVGSPWNGHEVITAAARAGVESGAVVFAGFVPKDHVPHFLRAATAAIYPSLFEGFGLPVIEAMACGTPVACSRSSSLTEIAEGHGLLFEPTSGEEIADAVRQLAADGALREQLRAKGLAHARKFTWERSVDETVAVWRKSLEHRS